MANNDTYKTFGRHTSTGKLLYNIYNAHQRNTYQPKVKLVLNKEQTDPHEEHLAKLRKERQILRNRKNAPISDPCAPQERKKAPKIFSMRGRKPRQIIEGELENIEKEANKLPIQKPIQPRSTKIKELQTLMETGKKANKSIDNRKVSIKKTTQAPAVQLSEKETIQEHMDLLLKDICERQQFLQEMRELQAGNLTRLEKEIGTQIRHKTAQFKKLDSRLKQLA